MSKIRKMMKNFEKAMSASAYAEAGEFGTAREMVSRKRKVLLGLESFDRNAITYAANISTRIDADLEVLYKTADNSDKPSEDIPKRLAAELSSRAFQYDLIRISGPLQKEILSHTAKRTDILFVVIGSGDEPSTGADHEEHRASAWKRLKCPLVVVSQNRLPATA